MRKTLAAFVLAVALLSFIPHAHAVEARDRDFRAQDEQPTQLAE